MAAVTQTGTPTRHILGDVVMRVFNLSGASGTTLQTGMLQVITVLTSPGSLITAVVQANIAGLGTQLTFTSSAPMTAEVVTVIARVG